MIAMKTERMQAEEARGFAEICRWLAEDHSIPEIMERLASEDIDSLERCGRCAANDQAAEYGLFPVHSLEVVREFCALSRIRSRARLVCECQ